jgi:hypothetical protein
LQLAKKDRTSAYHAKAAFMQEAMARHLAAAEVTLELKTPYDLTPPDITPEALNPVSLNPKP